MSDILTDPRLSKPMAVIKEKLAKIEEKARFADDWNDPRERMDRVSSGGGGPGRQQCEGFVKEMARVLGSVAKKLTEAEKDAEKKMPPLQEVRREPVESIGGVAISISHSEKVLRKVDVQGTPKDSKLVVRTRIVGVVLEELASGESVK